MKWNALGFLVSGNQRSDQRDSWGKLSLTTEIWVIKIRKKYVKSWNEFECYYISDIDLKKDFLHI